MNILLLHYTHPEGYPPTFNAINCMAKKVEQLTILSTDTLPTQWEYNHNVELILLDGEHDRFKAMKRSKFKKIKSYYNYVKTTLQLLNKNTFDLVVIYDNIPFLFYILATKFTSKKTKIWYHNHDVYPLSHYKKYSINWFAAKSVQKHFNKIHYFSLPATERKKMYPLSSFNGKFFYIPNYPSANIIKVDTQVIENRDSKKIKIVYPGSPSHKNGFEELIDVLSTPINGKTLELTIVGDINPKVKHNLNAYAKAKNVSAQLVFHNRVPYVEMPKFLQQFHIGWAVYKPVDLSVATAGSSSNKIYEFLANSLPIIVFDNEHHHTHLKDCEAAFYTNLSSNSIIQEITTIDNNYTNLVNIARLNFENKYQFEKVFNNVFESIKSNF